MTDQTTTKIELSSLYGKMENKPIFKFSRQINNKMFTKSKSYSEYMNLVRTFLPKEYLEDFYNSINAHNIRNESVYANIAYLCLFAQTNDKLKISLDYLNCYQEVAIHMIEDNNPIDAFFNYVKHQLVTKLCTLGDEWEHLLAWLSIIPISDKNIKKWSVFTFRDDDDYNAYLSCKESAFKQYLINNPEENNKLFIFFEKHLANNIIK